MFIKMETAKRVALLKYAKDQGKISKIEVSHGSYFYKRRSAAHN